MRHNQNGRRFRGRNNGNQNGGNNHNNNRRMNPKTQTFDSNGPEVRIRGNAYQIFEKYIALAKDARGAGDRVLAESYSQHAEHYQRLINEMVTAQERISEQRRQEQGTQDSGHDNHDDDAHDTENDLDDLDQGFLVGDRDTGEAEGEDVQAKKTVAARSRKPNRKTERVTEEVSAV